MGENGGWDNPYRTPAFAAGLEPRPKETIPPFRAAVNVGCGVAGVLVMVPTTVLVGLGVFSGQSSPRGLLMAIAFTLGLAHSVVWASRRRSKPGRRLAATDRKRANAPQPLAGAGDHHGPRRPQRS